MRSLIGAVAFCLLTLPALCQSTSKYQVAIITDVEAHQVAGDAAASDNTNYDVYVYATLGRTSREVRNRARTELVEKDAITYNEMLGRSLQVAIESQSPASGPKHAK